VGFIPESSVSLIVTSPPYLNAYDYHKYHRQRLHWIDGDVDFARDIEIGTHDEFTRPGATPDSYFEDMDACFAEWERVLRPKARCLVVIGDAIVSKKAVRVADTFIDLMERRGMPLEKHWIRELHATSRTFNVRNSRITHEHVLLFRKEAL
jgi:DNA modification methylase